MQRVLEWAETIAGAVLLCMTIVTSVSAFTRYLFSAPIPDEYEISRHLLGIVVCWAAAAALHRDEHIQVDIFWNQIPAGGQRILEAAGTALCLAAIAGLSWAMAVKVLDAYGTGIETVDLGLAIWMFYVPAWAGTILMIIVLAAKTARSFARVLRP